MRGPLLIMGNGPLVPRMTMAEFWLSLNFSSGNKADCRRWGKIKEPAKPAVGLERSAGGAGVID